MVQKNFDRFGKKGEKGNDSKAGAHQILERYYFFQENFNRDEPFIQMVSALGF